MPITLQIDLFHVESMSLYVISSPKNQLILGHPWLTIHDPHISWAQRDILRRSLYCISHCFQRTVTLPCFATNVESPDDQAPTKISEEYADLAEVFSKVKSSPLPSHRPWDCAIRFLPNAALPRSKVYPLSLPETKAMKNYIRRP